MPAVPTTDVRIRISATAAQANRTFRDLNTRLRRPNFHLERLNLQFRRLDRIWGLMAIGAGALIIRTFVKMASELQRTQLQIAVFTRDMEKVPDVMQSLISLTERVPFTLNAMTTSFVRLKASGIEPIIDAQGNGPLKNMADAVAAFGGGEEIFKRLTIGIQQMAGKGVVSMEELRQQIGEAVPLAMRIMAEQMGISVAKLITDVSRGKVEVERGLTALFKGFEEKFKGAGELLKNTFSGQLQQTRLEFEKLSKVLLLDSGALDFLTAALKVFNQELNAFGEFMSSPAGAQAAEDFWLSIEKIAIFAEQAIAPLMNLISIVSSLGTALVGLTGAIPAELVGGGILGFILFGRAGIAVGVLFAIFSNELSAIASAIAGFINSTNAVVAGLIGTGGLLAGAGLMGFWLFGPAGAIAALVSVSILGMTNSIDRFLSVMTLRFAGFIANVKAQWKELQENTINSFTNPGDIIKKGKQAEAQVYKDFFDAAEKAKEVLEGGSLKNAADAGGEFTNEATSSLQKFIDKLKELVPEMQSARKEIVETFRAIRDEGGLTPQQLTDFGKLGTFLERLEIKAAGAGSQIERFQATVTSKVKKIDEIIAQVTKTIEKMGASDSKVAGLRKEIEDLAAMKDRIQELGNSIVQNMGDKALGGIESRIKRITEALKVFTSEGTQGSTLMEIQLDKVNARFAGMRSSLEQLTRDVIEKTAADANQAVVLARLAELNRQLNLGLAEQLERVRKLTQARQEAAAANAEIALSRGVARIEILEMENAFDDVGLAAARAEARIQSQVNAVIRQMKKLHEQIAKGIITPESGEALLAKWRSVLVRIGDEHDKLIERMKFAASDWGSAMNAVAASMENRLAESIDNVIHGTGSLKDTLLSFYDDITAALSRYLAKQALMAVFGVGAGGQGAVLGNIFGGGIFGGDTIFGALGSLFGAANGGQFMVGGRGGVDNNVMSINGDPIAKVSQGETVTVSPSGAGGDTHIHISAIDSMSVRDLFMREGSSLIAAINSRSRVNRGFGF